MGELGKAINLAMEKLKERHGEDSKLEEGDEFVTVFNNCILIVSFEEGCLEAKFIDEKPFYADMTISVYESKESEDERSKD